jgi:hypothetical protein
MSFGGQWYEDTWPNPWAPRVTHCLLFGCVKNVMGVRGVRPPDLPHYVILHKSSANQHATDCFLICMWVILYLSCILYRFGGGSGRGLASTRGPIT